MDILISMTIDPWKSVALGSTDPKWELQEWCSNRFGTAGERWFKFGHVFYFRRQADIDWFLLAWGHEIRVTYER